MPSGRPTKYTPELLKAAEEYLAGAWEDAGDVVPTVVGLAIAIGIQKSTCYAWAKEPGKERFSDILEEIENKQEQKLVNGGLEGKFVSPIAKMMLTKHGYSDKIEQDHKSSDGSMTPKGMADFYADAGSDDE